LGTLIHPFFFTFHLSEIIIRYPTLKSVINSVIYPRTQLFLTYILYLIITYIFTLAAFVFFYEDFDGNCNDMLYCYFFLLD